MIKRLKALAKDAKLDPAFAEKFLNFIIAEVIRHHESIRNGGRPHSQPGHAPRKRGVQ
jgi:chorismate mutase